MEGFVEKLVHEYGLLGQTLKADTVFFGGGTPTALSISMLQRLLSLFIPTHHSSTSPEVSMECNPSTLSVEKAKILIKQGVNRLSIGAQSFSPEILKTLGRTHAVEAIQACVKNARTAGFANINLDLIFGVPGQTLDSWKETLHAALALRPRHISCYGLTYEADTEFFIKHQCGELKDDNTLELSMFECAHEILTGQGFEHYEISNYALPGYECLHNLAYWKGADYHGIGPSAVSTVNGVRRRNSKLDTNGWKVEFEESLSPATIASERMAFGLRTEKGVDPREFAGKCGFLPEDRWRNEISTLLKSGLITTGSQIQLTPRGRQVADEIAVYFV
jgi:oxygen-independent coproporphyrinogen-3 oxidase